MLKRSHKLSVFLLTVFSASYMFADNTTSESWKKDYSSPKYVKASQSTNDDEKINDNWSDDYSKNKYITASSIEALEGNTNSISPKVNTVNKMYLLKEGPLGRYGTLGSYGPLGQNGAVQKLKPYTPSLISTAAITDYYHSLFGSLDKDGPLGYKGPFTEDSYYKGELFLKNNFAVHIRAFGLWGVLGPLGPLGAVGPLGPLGPIGEHGYDRDKNGSYISDGKIVTQYTVPYDFNNSRTFDLYEFYDTKFASKKKDLDTSFLTNGSMKDKIDDDYIINSNQKQIVTILVTPKYISNHFYVELYNDENELLAMSTSNEYVNFIQFLAPKGSAYTIKVSSPDRSDEYSLYVTGGTQYLNKYNISGDHIKSTAA